METSKEVGKRVAEDLQGRQYPKPRSKAAAILRKHGPRFGHVYYERNRITCQFSSKAKAIRAGKELALAFPKVAVWLFMDSKPFVIGEDGKASCDMKAGIFRITVGLPKLED